jgi:hypothetical protein
MHAVRRIHRHQRDNGREHQHQRAQPVHAQVVFNAQRRRPCRALDQPVASVRGQLRPHHQRQRQPDERRDQSHAARMLAGERAQSPLQPGAARSTASIDGIPLMPCCSRSESRPAPPRPAPEFSGKFARGPSAPAPAIRRPTANSSQPLSKPPSTTLCRESGSTAHHRPKPHATPATTPPQTRRSSQSATRAHQP